MTPFWYRIRNPAQWRRGNSKIPKTSITAPSTTARADQPREQPGIHGPTAGHEDTTPPQIEASGMESMKLEINKIDDVYDKKKGRRVFLPYDPKRGPGLPELPSPNSGAVLVYRRVFSDTEKPLLTKTVLDIKSYLIVDVLKAVVLSQRAELEGHSSIKWPNDDVFRYRAKIRQIAIAKGGLTLRHVNVLLELIEQEYVSRVKEIDDLFPKNLSNYRILREAFWPGDIIVDSPLPRPRAYRVTSAWYDDYDLNIETEYMDCDGSSFGRVSKTFEIKKFTGTRYISELLVFPLKYHPEQEWARGAMVHRGREFAALRGQHHKSHEGIAWRYPPGRGRVTVNSHVMIDTKTFNRLMPNNAIFVAEIDELDDDDLTEEDYMLMTDTVPIFSFAEKEFCEAKIDNIKDKKYNETCFDQLVLGQDKKELIRTVVDAHSKSGGFDDFVEGKGKGLVILLHGPPGVGKTMTAETVAEHTRRPLYTITSGELGTSAKQLETALKTALDLAKTFRAVLLLDEADVFLEKRSPHDVERNALVSIFLRLLEYYQGVLFLTTNRISQFDDAFHSRIHIALRFAKLTRESRKEVWKNFIKFDAGAAVELANLNEADYDELAKWELNGRQIKNVLSCSTALSAGKGGGRLLEAIKQVLDVASDFTELG